MKKVKNMGLYKRGVVSFYFKKFYANIFSSKQADVGAWL